VSRQEDLPCRLRRRRPRIGHSEADDGTVNHPSFVRRRLRGPGDCTTTNRPRLQSKSARARDDPSRDIVSSIEGEVCDTFEPCSCPVRRMIMMGVETMMMVVVVLRSSASLRQVESDSSWIPWSIREHSCFSGSTLEAVVVAAGAAARHWAYNCNDLL
jgi:hypothetical protein